MQRQKTGSSLAFQSWLSRKQSTKGETIEFNEETLYMRKMRRNQQGMGTDSGAGDGRKPPSPHSSRPEGQKEAAVPKTQQDTGGHLRTCGLQARSTATANLRPGRERPEDYMLPPAFLVRPPPIHQTC